MNTSPIKLIVGLGNPGEKYAKTRHNAGFLFLDRLCGQTGAVLKADKRLFGRSGKTLIADQEVRLLTPDTFMNLSGQSVLAAKQFYKLKLTEILIVHDELDLDPGVARFKLGGGHGGNNGLRDVIQRLGSKDFARLRIGIGHPGTGKNVSNWVLKSANKTDQAAIDEAVAESLRLIDLVVWGDIARAMNELHTKGD